MALTLPTQNLAHEDKPQWFQIEAAEVLSTLRERVALVLSDLGIFSRPAEVQHTLGLDKSLGRQIFKLASTAEPLGAGSVVPSRTSIGRFLDVAKDRGVDNEKLRAVWAAFESFEKFVATHAGDRVTFNSMISAAGGVDDDWIAADIQHRRNAFRAMSHTIGMQVKTRLHLTVVKASSDTTYAMANISGSVGLRVLRALPMIRVDGLALYNVKDPGPSFYKPLGLTDAFGGHLLEDFSSKPLPHLILREANDESTKYNEILLDRPEIGNTAASTLMLGSLYQNIPVDDRPFNLHFTAGKPSEVLFFDVLIEPTLWRGTKPTGKAILGYNEKYGSEIIPLEGNFDAEFLGNGPAALATPEVPRYKEMLRAVSDKLGWPLEEYNAWRIRVEYPLYQSTLTMSWPVQKS